MFEDYIVFVTQIYYNLFFSKILIQLAILNNTMFIHDPLPTPQCHAGPPLCHPEQVIILNPAFSIHLLSIIQYTYFRYRAFLKLTQNLPIWPAPSFPCHLHYHL